MTTASPEHRGASPTDGTIEDLQQVLSGLLSAYVALLSVDKRALNEGQRVKVEVAGAHMDRAGEYIKSVLDEAWHG